MYFNHAFRKSLLAAYVEAVPAVPASPGPSGLVPSGNWEVDQLTVGSTADLTAGQIGLFDAKTFQAFTDNNGGKPFIIAQGSYFTKDKIGPYHGGYQESVKSKVINPKYISKVFTACSTPPVNQVKEYCVCKVECGKTYRLRLDLKGSPALRFLSHNIYKTLDAFTGCCTDDCTAVCTGALVDPTIVAIKWAKQIVESPILKDFLQVEVKDWDGALVSTTFNGLNSVEDFIADLDAYEANTTEDFSDADIKACLSLRVAYIDTKFGNCTFTPRDFYEVQPLLIYGSMTDESGDPCNVQCFTETETVAPVQAQGLGETVLRDLILTGRYRQEAFPDSSHVDHLRMREIEANPVLSQVDRNGFFNSINILHSVPRFNNPTGTFDNDQYLITIYVENGVDASNILNQLESIINNSCVGECDKEIEKYCAGYVEDVAPPAAPPEGFVANCDCLVLSSPAVPASPVTETTTQAQG